MEMTRVVLMKVSGYQLHRYGAVSRSSGRVSLMGFRRGSPGSLFSMATPCSESSTVKGAGEGRVLVEVEARWRSEGVVPPTAAPRGFVPARWDEVVISRDNRSLGPLVFDPSDTPIEFGRWSWDQGVVMGLGSEAAVRFLGRIMG